MLGGVVPSLLALSIFISCAACCITGVTSVCWVFKVIGVGVVNWVWLKAVKGLMSRSDERLCGRETGVAVGMGVLGTGMGVWGR